VKLAKAEVFEKGRSYEYLRRTYPEFHRYPTPFPDVHPNNYTVDFKIHNFQTGEVPCSPHWHVDRAHASMTYFLGLFGDAVSHTEFLRTLKPPGLSYGAVDIFAEEVVKRGDKTWFPSRWGPYYCYSDQEIHRATPATAPGRRVLIRYNIPTHTLKENV
jgi:hypothetical protein